ncbi:MAG TPA: choice-of-anchor Q domain-containing protein [Solirubrobacterales bacterium]|nr:choice-of-anchor Q domain-containing protein [Solirubrobacterales bacterium]
MRKSIALAGALMALALVVPAANAATFTVNTTADTSVPGGCTSEPACSLRDAVLAANSSPDPEDVVVVPAGNYLLSGGELATGSEGTITIRGAGARKTVIDAQGASRVLNLGAQRNVVEGLTVTGGNTNPMLGGEVPGDGGGVLAYEAEEAVLQGVNVTGNLASQNGAGVSAPPEGVNRTVLSIANSTIANNRVTGGAVEGLGGGIYALGKLSLVNSTVTGNSAESSGLVVQGGGVLLAIDPAGAEGSEGTVVNSTIAGNSVGATGVGGGLAVYNPEPTLGGSATLLVKNTIVAGNSGPAGESDCAPVAVVTSDHNISGDASCMFTDAGSKQNTNPLLGGPANNGGETDTLALQAGSRAIDAGTNDGCPPSDQRGVSRPQGTACDIGAFELVPAPPAAASANLRLKIKPKPKRPVAGGKLAFLVTVANRGPSTATGVVVKGTVPALTRKVAGKKVNGKRACKLGKVKGGKRKLTCRLGDLATGKQAKLRVVVKTKHAGKVRVRARVRSGVTDPNLKDNKARRGVKIRA